MNRRSGIVLALWLLLLALAITVIAHTRFSADLSAFLPRSPDPQQQVLIEQLGSGVAARTLMLGIEGGDAPTRAQASRAVAQALRASGLFAQVANGEREAWAAAGERLFEQRYLLSPAVTPQRFTPAGLRDALEDTYSLLGTPAGASLRPLLERDPTGETQRIGEALLPANAPRMDDGVWVSRTRPRALLLLTTRAGGGELDAQAQALAAVHQACAPWAARGLKLLVSGPPVFSLDSRARIEHEAKALAAVGLAVVGALLWLAFASARALAVAFLPVASGVLLAIAVVGLAFGTVHGLTLGFGITLIGEGVDYAIYYLIQARQGGWRHWRDTQWPTVRLGLLTSVCGFAALAFSGFPGLAQLGVFSVAGLVGAAMTTRFVLPVLVPQGAGRGGWRDALGRVTARAAAHAPRWRLPLLALGLVAAMLLAVHGGRLWRGDLSSLSPVPPAMLQLDAELRAELGAGDSGTLVVATGRDVQAALRAAEAAGARLEALVDDGTLAGYDSPARLLPSEATQQARRAGLPEAATLHANILEATRGGPLAAHKLAPFIAQVQAARKAPPVTIATWAGTPLQPLLEALLFQRPGGGWAALLALQPPPGKAVDLARVRTALAPLAGSHDVQVLQVKPLLDALYARYLREAQWQSVLGALAVVAVVAWQLRSARRVLAVCEPLALALLFTLAGFALLDVPLNLLHLVGLLLVVAVGSNYGLFFDQWRHGAAPADTPPDADTLASLLLANLTTVITFGLVALSGIPSLSAIGRVVAPGALLALLLSAACTGRRPVRDGKIAPL